VQYSAGKVSACKIASKSSPAFGALMDPRSDFEDGESFRV